MNAVSAATTPLPSPPSSRLPPRPATQLTIEQALREREPNPTEDEQPSSREEAGVRHLPSWPPAAAAAALVGELDGLLARLVQEAAEVLAALVERHGCECEMWEGGGGEMEWRTEVGECRAAEGWPVCGLGCAASGGEVWDPSGSGWVRCCAAAWGDAPRRMLAGGEVRDEERI